MKNLDIAQLRLHNQYLASQKLRKPADVIRWMGAVQAQDYQGAKWGLGQRLVNATDESVEKAFNTGQILRTHAMRPTWHFVAPDDIHWLLKLTAPSVNARLASAFKKYGLDEAVFRRSNKTLAKALKGGNQLTRDGLRTVLKHAGISTENIRFVFLLCRAEIEGVICSGARVGKQFTYALLEERAPQTTSLTRDQALAELTRRYFQSHGPATLHDFVWWSGLAVRDARNGVEMNNKVLVSIEIEGKSYWMSSRLTKSDQIRSRAQLLPTYDEYLVAYKNRDAVLGPLISRQRPRELGLTASLVFDGQVIGTWKRSLEKKALIITLQPYYPLNKVQKSQVKQAAERYGEFLGMRVTVKDSLAG